MDNPHFQQHGGPNPSHPAGRRRLHHSPFFWIAAVFILAAMVIYVMTDNLAFRPGKPPQEPVPAVAP